MRRRRLLKLGIGACGIGAAWLARAQTARTGSTALHLLRTGDLGGLPWIEVRLDGTPTRWLVDSGATTALVTPALADRLGLRRLAPVRVTAAGGAQTLDRYTLPPLQVLGDAAGTSTAVALDLETLLGAAGLALDGVLGSPWLREIVTTFDFARGELRWARTATALAPATPTAAAAATLPLRWDGGLAVAALALGARAADPFLFDTGNAGALVVFARRAQALLAEAGALPETTTRELGGSVHARYARIDRLSAAGFTAREVPAALEVGAAARRGGPFDRLAGSVGVALFEAGAVTLDGPGARLIVELPGLPEPPPLPGGFGLALSGRGGASLVVAAVLDASPAAAAGIRAGDAMLAIDGVNTRGWMPAQAWAALAGRSGAVFDVARDNAPPRRVRLERQRFFPLLR